MATVRCGNCGSLVKLPENSSLGMGMTISKSSFGDFTLKMEKENNTMVENTNNNATVNNTTNNTTKENRTMTIAEQRIEALKVAGIDTSKYFTLGTDQVAKMSDDGSLSVVVDDNAEIQSIKGFKELVDQITEDGEVFNRVLDGRWIMAQMFHMLNYENKYRYGKGYNDALNHKGYMYQWNFLANRNHGKDEGELLRLAKRELDNNLDGVKELCFNSKLVVDMMYDYVNKLRSYMDTLPVRYFKKKNVGKDLPYYRLGQRYAELTGKAHGDIFVTDINRDVISKYHRIIARTSRVRSYRELDRCVREFENIMIALPYDTLMCADFKDAYKKNGAYYTLNNLVKFHGCTVDGCHTKEEALNLIRNKAIHGTGWELLGMLKEVVEDNDFDFAERMRELNQ